MKYKMENPKWEHRNFIHQEEIFLMNIGMVQFINVCFIIHYSLIIDLNLIVYREAGDLKVSLNTSN